MRDTDLRTAVTAARPDRQLPAKAPGNAVVSAWAVRLAGYTMALGLMSLTANATSLSAGSPAIGKAGKDKAGVPRDTAATDPTVADDARELRGSRGPKAAAVPVSATSSQIKWLGPDEFAGRIRSVLIHPSNANIIYAGAATGGVWKSTDGGASWTSLDDFMPTQVIGSLAMDPSDPDTIFAGTGEIFTLQADGLTLRSADRGQGIFVSRNAGNTWKALAFTQTGTEDWRFVSRIAIDPSSSLRIFAATSTGLWRSTDGGESFVKALGGIFLDVRIHPKNPRNVVASSLGGLTMFSNNRGDNWFASTFPAGTDPADKRVELAAVPTAGHWRAILLSPGIRDNIVLLSSDDGGAQFGFTAIGGPPVSCRADGKGNNRTYSGALWVDPRDANKMLVGGVQLCRVTINGGVQMATAVAVPKASDFHAIVEHPGFAMGADDGILVGFDQGLKRVRGYDTAAPRFESLNHGLRTTQFHAAATNPISGDVIGTSQDTSVLLREGEAWRQPIDAIEDGGMAATEAGGPDFLYFGLSQGRTFRSLNGGATTECISAQSGSPIGESLADGDCGPAPVATFCGGKTPMLLDPNDANRLYIGCGQLWRTTDARAAAAGSIDWASVKPRNGDFFINTMDVPRGDSNLMWVGTLRFTGGDVVLDGQLWMRTNATADVVGPADWKRKDTDLPDRPVFDVVVDPRNHQKVYVSFSGFFNDNVWKTSNGGDNWTPIGAGLPEVPVWSLAIHPTKAGWLYAGTDVGLYTSTDDGANWSATTRGPATVAISDLQWKGDTPFLTIATYGRGVHELDASPNPEHLFPERATTSGVISGHVENLLVSDRKRFTVGRKGVGNVSATLTTRGGFTQADTPAGSGLIFAIRSVANENATETLELFNFVSNRFETMRTVRVDADEERTLVQHLSSGAHRFISPTTRQLTARITWTKLQPLSSSSFSVGIDAATWIIDRP